MTDKAVRDAQNNAMFKDIYVHVDAMPWIPHPVIPGTHFKVLRTSAETGAWTVLFKNAKGSSVPRHEHLGAGEYFILSGKATSFTSTAVTLTPHGSVCRSMIS